MTSVPPPFEPPRSRSLREKAQEDRGTVDGAELETFRAMRGWSTGGIGLGVCTFALGVWLVARTFGHGLGTSVGILAIVLGAGQALGFARLRGATGRVLERGRSARTVDVSRAMGMLVLPWVLWAILVGASTLTAGVAR